MPTRPPRGEGGEQRRARWFDAARELATAAVEGGSPDGLLQLATRHARELLGGDVAVAHLAGEDGRLRVAAADGDLTDLVGMRSSVVAPLRLRTGRAGSLLVATTSAERRLDGEELELLLGLAQHLAVVLEHARSRRELSRLTGLDARTGISTDLHDGVVQTLYAVGLGLEGTAAAAEDPWLRERIESALADIDAVIGEVRSLIVGLPPDIVAGDQ